MVLFCIDCAARCAFASTSPTSSGVSTFPSMPTAFADLNAFASNGSMVCFVVNAISTARLNAPLAALLRLFMNCVSSMSSTERG